MISDFLSIFSWWILLLGLGLVFLPLTWFFFRNFFDLGYSFSKIIAILLVSYLVWLIGSLHILPFSVLTIWLVILVLVLGNIFLLRKFREEIIPALKSSWKFLVLEEILFFTALVFWSFIRGFQPDIEGLEKFMDFGFVNSILRSQFFPPADMWMSGKTINYYYFGHLVAAILTKISGLDSAITYNLMIATIFALSFTAVFSLGGNFIFHWKLETGPLRREARNWKLIFIAGLLSASLLTLGGNLHPLWWFLTHNFSFAGYWYPDATRFIVEKFGALDNTIHEFPLYSFVVSDLHGHVSNIPFVLLFLALLFSLIVQKNYTLYAIRYTLPLSLSLAVMYMTNSWDFPIYFLVFGAVISYFYYLKYGFSLQSLYSIGLLVVLVFIGSILFSLPFHLNFSQIAQGINFVHAHSPFWQLSVLWGYQWIIGLSFFIFFILKKLRITCLAGRRANYELRIPDIFIFILLVIATLLIVIPEIVYVKDIYIPSYHRANTVFKLVYQSFVMSALASGYIVVRLLPPAQKRLPRLLFAICYLLFAIFIFIYPYFAITSYYGNFKKYQGLYGLNFLKRESPDDFAAILWLQENVRDQPASPTGGPVIVEAAGDSYTQFNRVSAITGLPTVQGWLVHEWLWRGGFEEPGKRAAEVETIFASKNLTLTKNLLEKYQVKYVFVGGKEREKYQVSEDKFKSLGSLVFSRGNTKIYFLEKVNTQ